MTKSTSLNDKWKEKQEEKRMRQTKRDLETGWKSGKSYLFVQIEARGRETFIKSASGKKKPKQINF